MEIPSVPADLPWLNVILFEPEIAFNTGAIGRTCLAIGARLRLVRPLGFRMDERNLKRAGMDYWKQVDCHVHDAFEEAVTATNPGRIWLLTTKGTVAHWDADFAHGDTVVFGPESRGLPDWILNSQPESAHVRIPMMPGTRSLNLSNAAAITMYEAARRIRPFPDLPIPPEPALRDMIQ